MVVTFHHVQVALTVAAFGCVGVGDLFKNKGFEATYRLFNGLSSVFALALFHVMSSHQWHTNNLGLNIASTVTAPLLAMVFGYKAIESFKLAAKIRRDRLFEAVHSE